MEPEEELSASERAQILDEGGALEEREVSMAEARATKYLRDMEMMDVVDAATDEVKYQCPSGLPEAEERKIQRIVVQAYRTLGCRGWGRADLMIRACDRKPFLLEMNTSPGMTTHSLVPMSAKAAGLSYEALCVHILCHAALDAASGGPSALDAPAAPGA